jgi:AcrR family transcriptional regulator
VRRTAAPPPHGSRAGADDYHGRRRARRRAPPTVYRHFPDEAWLFDACSSHWAATDPPPDLDAWAAVADPAARLRRALTELYADYARTEPMRTNLLRDAAVMPTVGMHLQPFHDYTARAQAVLLRGRRDRGRRRARVAAAVGLALPFPTWRSLTREQGLENDEAVELMCRLIDRAD